MYPCQMGNTWQKLGSCGTLPTLPTLDIIMSSVTLLAMMIVRNETYMVSYHMHDRFAEHNIH